MTYDITKHLLKKNVLQKYDFLFVWNANLNFFKENFLFVIISAENRAFILVKNLKKTTSYKFFFKFLKKILQNYVFLYEWIANLN